MSAMFDDWAYQSVYEPVSPPREANKDSLNAKRARAASIVKSVAHTPSVPEPEVRTRSNSESHLPEDQENLSFTATELEDYPFTKDQYKKHWNQQKWLGSLSPSTYSFETQLWTERVAPYIAAREEAQIASKVAANSLENAQDLAREVSWIVHELRDTSEHDLSPLRQAAERKEELIEQTEMAKSVRKALAIAWDAQDRITRDLRGPALKAVAELARILSDINAGLKFCEEHPNFVGIDQCAAQFRNSAQRSLEIAVAYFAHELSKISERIASRASESAGARQALIETKFNSDVERLKPIVSLIRAHACDEQPGNGEQPGNDKQVEDEQALPALLKNDRSVLESYWQEVQLKYFDTRSSLLAYSINKSVAPLWALTHINDEFLDAARTSLVEFKQIYAVEIRAYQRLFGNLTKEFWNWLYDDLSDALHSAMRRVIVHETDIAKLGQIIVLVQNEADKIEQDSAIGDKESVIDGSVAGGSLLAGSLFSGSLAGLGGHGVGVGSSSRRPATNVTSMLSSTTPASVPPASVSTPARGSTASSFNRVLQGGEETANVSSAEEPLFDVIYKDAQNRLLFRANLMVDDFSKYVPSSKDMMRARYPTVEKTLELLGQVYQLLNARVFNDLAHRCVRECLASLDYAVANKVVNVGNDEAVRYHLFHVKQLLILQSQIVDFDLHSTVIREIDFSGVQRLLSRDTGGNARSFRDLIALAWGSVPQVIEIMFDAMEELYASLRRAIDRMCAAFVASVSRPLDKKNSREFRDTLSEHFTKLVKDIADYTNDIEVSSFLIDSVQEAVMDKYTIFYRNLSPEDLEDESLMDIDTMASWLSALIADINLGSLKSDL